MRPSLMMRMTIRGCPGGGALVGIEGMHSVNVGRMSSFPYGEVDTHADQMLCYARYQYIVAT